MPMLVIAGLILAGGVLLVVHFVQRRGSRGKPDDAYSEILELQQSLKQELDGLCTRLDALDQRRTSSVAGELQADVMEARLLDTQVRQDQSDYRGRSSIDLDAKLMEMLAVAIRTSVLTNKYAGANVAPMEGAIMPPASSCAERGSAAAPTTPIADLAA